MNKKVIKVFVVIIVAFTIFMAFGWSFFTMVVYAGRRKDKEKQKKQNRWRLPPMKINHPRHRYEHIYEEGKAWCQQQEMQDFYMRSNDNLLLHARYLPAEQAKRIVILCHGYKGNSFSDFAFMARYLHENGCHLLFIDQRCCGQSEGSYVSFGAKEQWDIQGWAYFMAKRNKEKLPIYLYGESMGAASVLMASGRHLPKAVHGLIADCGFQSMKVQLEDMAINWFRIRGIKALLFRMNIFSRLIGKFRMSDADTTAALKKNRRPVLFFHGGNDTFVAPKNSLYNYSICQAPKELVVIPGARHMCSPYQNPKLYRKKVMQFFDKYDKKSVR